MGGALFSKLQEKIAFSSVSSPNPKHIRRWASNSKNSSRYVIFSICQIRETDFAKMVGPITNHDFPPYEIQWAAAAAVRSMITLLVTMTSVCWSQEFLGPPPPVVQKCKRFLSKKKKSWYKIFQGTRRESERNCCDHLYLSSIVREITFKHW